MTFFDWLSTPGGLAFDNAIIMVLIAVANYITRRSVELLRKDLDGHITRHEELTEATVKLASEVAKK